jgi:hypothetical protein
MQRIAMQDVWVDGTRGIRADRTEGATRKLWKYGWGLLLVVAMTVLSEYGPRTVYSKVPSPPPASQSPVHCVK